MGASSSKVEEDKALRLCHERKKFVKQALHGRCSLATAHAGYIQSLRCTGTALRRFVEPEVPVESSLYTSTNATPEPLVLTEKSVSQFSFSSPSLSQRVDTAGNLSPSPSPPTSNRFQVNHMKFRGSFANKVEEKLPTPITGTVTPSGTPPSAAPQSSERPNTISFEDSSQTQETLPWDYFFPPNDHEFSFHDGNGVDLGFENADDLRYFKGKNRNSGLQDREDKDSFHEGEESQDSEDEFDEPATETLVRRFENFNRVHDDCTVNTFPTVQSPKSTVSESVLVNRERNNSPGLSPLRATSSVVPLTTGSTEATTKEESVENTVVPKDFFSSVKDIELLFLKASDSGKGVPRMLEANKLHMRPIFQGKENNASLLKSCFSCGDDPSVVHEEPAQTATKYLTWHRTASSRSSSSRNPLGGNSKEDIEDHSSSLFENFCMNSGSHASTLDRLYAWEKKLYDEVKTSEMVRKEYDLKCRMLRHLESKEVSLQKIDKTRAVIKDLHSRIRVAVHRIDSISKKIEELRDTELQPQLEELMDGLRGMWGVMSECHKLQFQIIQVATNHSSMKLSVQSETRRQNTIHLENELVLLSSSFTKWMAAHKSYLQSIDEWLLKCVSLPQRSTRGGSTKSKRKVQGPDIRNFGPPIYVTCGEWLKKMDALTTKQQQLVDCIRGLGAETARLLPHQQDKNQARKVFFKPLKDDEEEEAAASENLISGGFDNFRSRLVEFFSELSSFAESSVTMYAELEQTIRIAKENYEQWRKSQKVGRDF